MIFRPVEAIHGAWVIELDRRQDERGFFARTFCAREYAAHGIDARVAQCSLSYNELRGTLRGLHYQAAPHEEGKTVRCRAGAIFDVIADLRPGSPTRHRWFGVELAAERGTALYIPAGCAHGFLTLADHTAVDYFIDTDYVAEAARGIRWDDPTLAITWPFAPVRISERDRAFPVLLEAEGVTAARRLFVTGATGFVGAPLVAGAVDRGWEVIALLVPGDEGARLAPLGARVQLVRGTLADPGAWQAEVARAAPQAAVHLAWNTTPGSYLETRENLDWLAWSARLFALLPGWGCRRIVGVGSCAEYAGAPVPLREDAPVGPSTLYAASKAALRLVGPQLAAQQRAQFLWARIFHLYGPHEHPGRLVPACIRALLAGGEFPASAGTQVRDYLHVEDVASGLLAALESDLEGDVNVCSGEAVQVRAVLQAIEAATGRPGAVKLGARPPAAAAAWDPAYLCGDGARLRSTGWRPRYTLEAGIADAARWWREQH